MARTIALCEDDAIIGSTFYVMEFLDGRVFWDQRLPGLAPTDRRAMFDSMNAVIAALHSVDHIAVGLDGFGREETGEQRGKGVAHAWPRATLLSQLPTSFLPSA